MVKPVAPEKPKFPDIADSSVASLLQRVLNNIILHPLEEKYRSLNTAGAAFAKLRDDTAAQTLLKLVGFEPREARLVLDTVDVALVQSAIDELQRQAEKLDPTSVAILPALRVPEARDLIFRRGLNPPTLAACRLHDPESLKSGVCDSCKKMQLMVDDYAVCWRCHAYFCMMCVCNIPSAAQLNVRKIGGDLAQQGHWAKCPECDAPFGAPQIPVVICSAIGASVVGTGADISNVEDNAGLMMYLDIDFVRKQAAFADTTGDTFSAIEFYTRAITICNYIRSRLPRGYTAAFNKIFHDLHYSRALLENKTDLAQQIDSFIAEPVPFLTVDNATRRFMNTFISIPELRKFNPDLEFRYSQDCRLLRQPPMTKGLGSYMNFPFPDADFKRLGGVHEGLVVVICPTDVQLSDIRYSSVRMFVREFPTPEAALEYHKAFAENALELTSIITLPGIRPIQHGEAVAPRLPGVSACRVSVSCGIVKDARAMCNVNFVFSCGVFVSKLYMSYVIETNPVLPQRAQLQDFEQKSRELAEKAVLVVLNKMA